MTSTAVEPGGHRVMGREGDGPGVPASVPGPAKAGPAEDWGPGEGLVLAPTTAAAMEARGMAGPVMRLWGVGADGVEAAVLVLSEVVANAATATARLAVQPPVRFWIRPRLDMGDMGAVLVTVWDASPDVPVPPGGTVPAGRESGRGLLLVDALSAAWGWESWACPPDGVPGKSVWCVIPC